MNLYKKPIVYCIIRARYRDPFLSVHQRVLWQRQSRRVHSEAITCFTARPCWSIPSKALDLFESRNTLHHAKLLIVVKCHVHLWSRFEDTRTWPGPLRSHRKCGSACRGCFSFNEANQTFQLAIYFPELIWVKVLSETTLPYFAPWKRSRSFI